MSGRKPRRGNTRHRDGPKERKGRDRPAPDRARSDELVKGRHGVFALLQHQPQRVRRLFLWGKAARATDLLEAAADAGIAVVHRPPDDAHATDNLAQGIAASVAPYPYAELDDIAPAGEPRFVVLLDSITDPRNLGAIIRSAAFFAVDAIVIPKDRSAAVTPMVERIARGGAAVVPIARVTNLARTVQQLRDRGYTAVATALDPAAVPLSSAPLRPPIALVLGGEGRGVRRLVAKSCDLTAIVPALGPMQSLNVASFATLCMAAVRGFQGADSA